MSVSSSAAVFHNMPPSQASCSPIDCCRCTRSPAALQTWCCCARGYLVQSGLNRQRAKIFFVCRQVECVSETKLPPGKLQGLAD